MPVHSLYDNVKEYKQFINFKKGFQYFIPWANITGEVISLSIVPAARVIILAYFTNSYLFKELSVFLLRGGGIGNNRV